MHPIPLNLDLSVIRGLEVSQIAIGKDHVIINLHPGGSITLEGNWTLRDPRGETIDCAMGHWVRRNWRIHRLIGLTIDGSRVRDDHHLEISFGNLTLEIETRDDRQESFSIVHSGFSHYV